MTTDVEKVLNKYEEKYDNSIALFFSSRKGLNPQAAFDLINITSLAVSMIEVVLDVTVKTLGNYKLRKVNLDPVLSEKVLSIFALYKKGISIFGTVDEFNKWLAEPAHGLGGLRPADLLVTITGINLINEELIRIEYGDLA